MMCNQIKYKLRGNLSSIIKSGIFLIMIILSSCMDDDLWIDRNKPNLDPSVLHNSESIIIINEGNYMYGNSSLSFYNKKDRNVYPDVYYRQNGSALGDVAQSAVVRDGLLYVVVNNSGRIMVLNFGKYPSLKLFDFVGKITGFLSPRYIHFISDRKAYVSDMYDRAINIVDPQRMIITGRIDLNNHNSQFRQHSSEQMISYGKFIFTNAYSYDNKILVIDADSDVLTDSIEVLKQPSSMVMDKNNKLWALCDGGYEGSEYGNEKAGLVRINAHTRTVEKVFLFRDGYRPSKLRINASKDTLYFINRDIWRMGTDENELPGEAFIKAENASGISYFYGLGIDPVNSDVYVADALDRIQNGTVYRYSSTGEIRDTIPAGILPGDFYFP